MSEYIPEDSVNKIKDLASRPENILSVIRDFRNMEERKGYDFRGVCPMCGKETFNFNTKKVMFGCFDRCNVGGRTAIDYLMKCENMGWLEAMHWLANRFNVVIEEPEKPRKHIKIPKKAAKELKGEPADCFCTRMLAGSGLTYDDVTAKIFDKSENRTITSLHTFTKGTINAKREIDRDGDDVIISYYDIHGYPIKYEVKDAHDRPTGKFREYYRVRWQFPDDHLDKDGKPFKYCSPRGGGTPMYIPQRIRDAYDRKEELPRLFIQEGEKKAEKACKHNMPSLAISGILNIANAGRLSQDLIDIITTCKVKEIFFVMDSDWNDLSQNIKINDDVQKRPRNFFYAAKNFKEYINTLKNRDIYVEPYVGHVMPNSYGEKGIDDLLVGSLQGKEEELMKDFNFLINEKKLTGKYLQFFRIGTYTDYKLSSLWGLDSIHKFADMHKNVLSQLPEFKYGRNRWRINDKGKVESTNAIEKEEEFWEALEKTTKSGNYYTVYEFRYVPSRRFLENRGFGRFRRLDDSYMFIRREHPFVKKIEPSEARDFLFEFAENNCPAGVNEMLSKGVTQYVGPDKLSLLKYIEPNFLEPVGTEQFLYFKKTCWKITQSEVAEIDYGTISHDVWADEQRPFDAKYLGQPLITFEGDGDTLDYKLTEYGKKCDFLQFLINASNFTWRREREHEVIEQGEILENKRHLLSKLCAIGYMAMSYKDVSVNRAVIGMDGKQSEVGESNGRSGKSLIGALMKQIMPTAYVNGKRRDILEDQFVWNDVVENTRLVFIDDVLMNFNFERLFPNLTGDWTVNYKGGKRITFPYETSPKIYIATNHAIKGEGSSFADRQWLLGFSDFYNDSHKPIDDFGCNFFSEWDFEQWNLCWNMIANCIQLYLQYGVVQAPLERLLERRLRQEITETFILWADEYFSLSTHINTKIARKTIYDDYCNYDPTVRKFSNSPKEFKTRMKKYCKLKGYIFNPQKYDPLTKKPIDFDHRSGEPKIDDKSGGVEFFTIGNSDYYSSYSYLQESARSKNGDKITY